MAGKTDAPRSYARWPLTYVGTELDRGQVFPLAGAVNDEKLTRLGFIAPLDAKATTYTCAECGAEFVGELERRGHGDKRHSGRVLSALEEDQRADREERMLTQVAPLYTERSAATLAG